MRIRKRASPRKVPVKLIGFMVSVSVMVLALVQVLHREIDPYYDALVTGLNKIEVSEDIITKRQMTSASIGKHGGTSRTKIIGFANGPYRSIAAKWSDRLSSLGYNEHVIIATDNETAVFLEQQEKSYRYERVDVMTLPWSTAELRWAKKERLRKLYLFARRWTYILETLKQGTSVLLTDVDNIFSRFVPMSDFENSEYDVIHAYETKHPTEVFDQMGFVVCGGMGWFRADPKTINFIEIMIEQCGDNCDDQVRLNEVLALHLDMNWDETPETTGGNPLRVKSNDERYNGLLKIGKTGRSGRTGHRVKIWDRDFAFRGPLDPDTCPEKNWVAMPIYEAHTRQRAPTEKERSFDRWDAQCPSEYAALSEDAK